MIKKKKNNKENSERWLLTYSDLITLLMIFFVVMYAMSNVDKTKYKALSSSLSSALSLTDGNGGKSIIGSDGANITKSSPIDLSMVEETKLKKIKGEIDAYIKKNKLGKDVSTSIAPTGLIIRFNEALLFDTGKANIKPNFKTSLKNIGTFLNHTNNFIRIEGYSDNIPINNENFHSNWELSAVRSINVTQFFIEKCNLQPKKLSAVAYGEYRPISNNSNEVGRSKNRRVDIVVLKDKFSQTEKNKK